MSEYRLFWGLSAVALAAFMGYWAWRIEHGHRRRMQAIAADEARDREWQAEVAKARAAFQAQEPAAEYGTSRAEPAAR